MRVKQLSVFVENQPGRLVDMLKTLAESKVNISALMVADTADFGIVRLIVSDVNRGSEALRKAGFTVKVTDVLKAEMPDVPGGLYRSIAEPLAKAGINLEYFYAFIDPTPGKAVVVLKVADIDKAEKILG